MTDNIEQFKICELRAKGLMEEIDKLSIKPTVVCGKCGAKADSPDHLHNPRPLTKKKLDSFWG